MYGVLGLKLFFYYVPLLFVGYALSIPSRNCAASFCEYGSCAGYCFPGIAQAIIGHTFLNPQSLPRNIRELSGLYRMSPVTGLLMYRSYFGFREYCRYREFCFWLTLVTRLWFSAATCSTAPPIRGRALAFLVLVLTVAALALCASRESSFGAPAVPSLGVLLLLWGAPWRQREVLRVMRTVQRAALGIALGVGLLFFIFPDALLSRVAFYTETLTAGCQGKRPPNPDLGITRSGISSVLSATTAGSTAMASARPPSAPNMSRASLAPSLQLSA